MKAMILAAGKGSRLRPLTDHTPKPLTPIGSQFLIERNFEILKQAGICEVIINISHHATKIIEILGDGQRFGLHITYSYEPGEPLGTASGIRQALVLLGQEPFIIMSADIWSDFLITDKFTYLPEGHDAHLLLINNLLDSGAGKFNLQENGVISLESPRHDYAGIALVHPRLFIDCPAREAGLWQVLQPAIQRGAVTGELHQGMWFNVGTFSELNELRKIIERI